MINILISLFAYLETCFCCRVCKKNKVQPSPEEKPKYIRRNDDEHVIHFIRHGIELSPFQTQIFECRIVPILQKFKKESCRDQFLYYLSRFLLQSASLLIPALLGTTIDLFWVIWSLSLFVGVLTNLVHMFRWDRKHYMVQRTYQLLLLETWYFAEQINGYDMYSFSKYCENFEKIHYMYQEDENTILKKTANYLSPTASQDYRTAPGIIPKTRDPIENEQRFDNSTPIYINP